MQMCTEAMEGQTDPFFCLFVDFPQKKNLLSSA